MTKLIQETFEQISRLSEEQQNTLAVYLQKHLDEFLQQAEKEKRIEEETYTINDFNQETQKAIKNIEEQQNLTICDNKPTFRTSKCSTKRLRIFLELAIAVPGFGDRILPY